MSFHDDIKAGLAEMIEVGGESFTWDGSPHDGIINRQPGGDMAGYDSTVLETCTVLVLADGFDRPFPGSAHLFNGARWEVRRVRDLPGGYELHLERMIA